MTHKMLRAAPLVAIAAATALLIAGCASGSASEASSSAGSQKPVTLKMVWWGNDVRAQATLKAVKAFEKKYPNITVQTSTLPFDGYFDKLSTQIAANDAPDVQQLQGVNMVQYATQGALLDLDKVSTTDLDPSTTKSGKLDGSQIGVPTGLSTFVIVANPALFKAAGVDMPDDKTWTWDDYDKIAAKITADSSNGVIGAKSSGWDITEMATWAAQRGHQLFTKDGKLGANEADFASLFTLAKKMMDDKASPSASESSEQLTLAPEQSGVATGRYAMQLDGASNFPALATASKDPLTVLRLPSKSGKSGDAKMMYVASQYWGVSARTEHPVESQQLVEFLANSSEAGKILGVTRGTPANSKVREAILPGLAPNDKTVVDFMGSISDEVVDSQLAPAGAATFTQTFQRYTSEVLFGRMTPAQAAKAMIAEVNSAL
ncbi:MAG TPA: extracellular solute-binding protein [Leifsonia sp.]|nr:extracellular solute-binding protein [Leifsonia sp.]